MYLLVANGELASRYRRLIGRIVQIGPEIQALRRRDPGGLLRCVRRRCRGRKQLGLAEE